MSLRDPDAGASGPPATAMGALSPEEIAELTKRGNIQVRPTTDPEVESQVHHIATVYKG